MSFFGKLVGIGVTAAAAVAAAKVAKKYLEQKENNEANEFLAQGVDLEEDAAQDDSQTLHELETLDGVQTAQAKDTEWEPVVVQSGSVLEQTFHDTAEHTQEVLQGVAQAATDVWDETRSKAANAAENAGVDTEHLSESIADAGRALQAAGKAVLVAGSAVAHKVAEEAPVVIDKVKTQTGTWFEQMRSAVNTAYAQSSQQPQAHDAQEEAKQLESKPQEAEQPPVQ